MQIDHRLPDDALNPAGCIFADIGVDGELIAMEDQPAHDMVLDLAGVEVRHWNCKEQPKHSVPDFLYASDILEIDVCDGERLHQRHCTALHGLPPIGKDPNVDECAHFQALVATDSLAGAVHQASVVHRHAYIMVNGVLS